MNSKSVIILVIFFVLLNAVFFALYKGNLLKTKPAPLTQFSPRISNTIDLPVDPNRKNLKSFSLEYQFIGKVVKIEPSGQNVNITLDSSDFQTPAFIATPDTFVYHHNFPTERKTIKDVTSGESVIMTERYYPDKKVWQLVGIAFETK